MFGEINRPCVPCKSGCAGVRQLGATVIRLSLSHLIYLEDINKAIKVTGQIIELKPSSLRMTFWKWTRNYLSVASETKEDWLSHQNYVVEIPSFFIHPLGPTVVDKPPPGSSENTLYYPIWRLSKVDLQRVLDSLWDSLEPDTDNIIGNVHMLLSIKNPDALPYRCPDNTKEFCIRNLPDCLIPKTKFSANDKLSCHFCRDKVKLSQMWNHVGGHILCSLQGVEDTRIGNFWRQKAEGKIPKDERDPENLGENPCGFCGQDGCFTSLLEKNFGNSIKISITSNCPYHHE